MWGRTGLRCQRWKRFSLTTKYVRSGKQQKTKNRNKNTKQKQKQKHKTNYYNESDFFGIWYGCWIFFGHKLGLKRWGLDFHFLKAHSYSIQIFYCLLILFSFDWGEGGFDVNKKPLLYFIYIFILYFNWTLIPLIKEYYIKLVWTREWLIIVILLVNFFLSSWVYHKEDRIR